MLLTKVNFDAYKSLVDEHLELREGCIALVGRNESGKSNILAALACLSPDNELDNSATPKMQRELDPSLRFLFRPGETEQRSLLERVGEASLTAHQVQTLLGDATITYCVAYDREDRQELRFFLVDGVVLPAGVLVRRHDSNESLFKVRRNGQVVPLSAVALMTNEELNANEVALDCVAKNAQELVQARGELAMILARIEAKPADEGDNEEEVDDTDGEEDADSDEEDDSVEADEHSIDIHDTDEAKDIDSELSVEPADDHDADSAALEAASNRVQDLEKARVGFLAHFDGWDMQVAIAETAEALESARRDEDEAMATTEALSAKLNELATQTTSDLIAKEIARTKRSLLTQQGIAARHGAKKVELKKELLGLQQPLREKFATDTFELETALAAAVPTDWLPQVVFWEYKPEYILKGETEFRELKAAKTLQDIPRPLVNLFRIGLDVTSLEELLKKIEEIRDPQGQRSRYERKMNAGIKKYLESVWPDYDQNIRIALERDRIRVEFFDPNHEDAAYYTMGERSQGCQTFLSFLFTVGAEAKRGVIRDTVLLLDEPETRLHPSGVRHMLAELITAAKNGNNVIFATHSVFMIDRKNYDRHVIVSKRAERSVLEPSLRGRIGFFMQEEVLYGALDVNLNSDFESMKPTNFVFEGEGDATLFERMYSLSVASELPSKQKPAGFHHGGKCSDIKRYLTHKPIQLGSRWFFVLDNDQPAHELRQFLEGRYREHIDRSVFIFQYKSSNGGTEFEDLLPQQMVFDAMLEAARDCRALVGSMQASIGPTEPFSDYFERISAELADKGFKERTKASLNKKVASVAKSVSNHDAIVAAFSAYSEWAQPALERIRSALSGKPKPQSASETLPEAN
jgi:energy-coupling factor transporter ATP-binding protein EcfA2